MGALLWPSNNWLSCSLLAILSNTVHVNMDRLSLFQARALDIPSLKMTLQNDLQRGFFRYLEAINSEYQLWEDRLVVSEKLSRCSRNFWAASNTGADILCPVVFSSLSYFLVALYSLRPKSKYCFLAWHVGFSVAPCPAGLHGWSACMMREQFSFFAGRLLGVYLPKVSGGCPTFPAQKSEILRICKMDTWLSLCLLANRNSQQIDLLLIKEMLLETLLFFFFLFVCAYWQIKGIIHYSKLLKKRLQIARYEIMLLVQLPVGNGMWDVWEPTKEKVLCMCEFSIHKRCQIDSLGDCGDRNFIYP